MDILLILKALSNQKRLDILKWLKHPAENFRSATCDVVTDGVCVGLIKDKAKLSQSTVSQYLMQLHQAGLIHMERRGQWTYCKLNQAVIKQFSKELKEIL